MAKQITDYLQQYFTETLGQKTLRALRYDLYQRLEHLRLGSDKIVVLKDGGIAQIGTHEEVLARGHIYAKLYEPQLEVGRYEKTAQI